MSSGLKNLSMIGAGVLGGQIAWQSAFKGKQVVVYDINQEGLERCKAAQQMYAGIYQQDLGATPEQIEQTCSRLRFTTDLADAVAAADVVIEAVPEVPEIKIKLYQQMAELLPAHTIIATNSSTLLPSAIQDATGRPDRFIALHFANQIWKYNTAEVMGTQDTDPKVFDALLAFAADIGMVPIALHKEKAGYVLNSLLVPLLNAAAELAAGGYADPHDVDKVWRIATGAPLGPFQIYDIIGLTTPYNILSHGSEHTQQLAAWLKEHYIDHGKLGVASGEGFYRYDKTSN